jgi:hypothetical protein
VHAEDASSGISDTSSAGQVFLLYKRVNWLKKQKVQDTEKTTVWKNALIPDYSIENGVV